MNELLKYCLKVNGLKTYFPNHEKESLHTLESKKEMINKYNYENKKIAFVTSDGSYYVSPFYIEMSDYLSTHGFSFDNNLYVPFSRSNVPNDKGNKEIWEKLCKAANKKYEDEINKKRLEEYKYIAKMKNIQFVPDELINSSLELPKDGIEFISNNKIKKMNSVYDWQVPNLIGYYGDNLDTILYVNPTGKTYITPYSDFSVNTLNNCNFTNTNLYIPIHTYDKILNEKYNEKWLDLCNSHIKNNTNVKVLKKTI